MGSTVFAIEKENDQNDLSEDPFQSTGLPRFKEKLNQEGITSLKPTQLEIFQVNVGYMCNQTCHHCHVDAGPTRTEIMDREIMNLCLSKIREFNVSTVDLTGGAPEMNPDFKWFVKEIRKTGVKEIIVRSNLTIILANPKYHDLPDFFRHNDIRVVSSLPYYQAGKTDRQRGDGVFNKSINALKLLNKVGYGDDKILDLVYNPGGAFLPGNQEELEHDFKKALWNDHGIKFNALFALTNLPVNRYLEYLLESGNYHDYMERLVMSFNPTAIDGLMCRNTLSISHDGYAFDCDFNQMLNLQLQLDKRTHLSELSLFELNERNIALGEHCYGCTAGAGSSCQGSLV